ncbi:MAG TPA: ATP-binding protein [Vicinamibacteria bacterium]|nr:ATP-binding protein [Vicinamibacteria bacterium]
MRGLLRSLRDLSLRRKVTLALAVVFLFSVSAALLLLVPVLAEQRQRFLDQEKRLLSTLRGNYERYFIYDLLSRNRESLALDLGRLAGQEGILWTRVEAGDLDLGATADPAVIRRLMGPDAEPHLGTPGVVLLVNRDGEADLVGPGGRPLVAGRIVAREEAQVGGLPHGQEEFQETLFGGQRVLALVATLSAAGDAYGRLHLLKSLAPLERSESATRSLFYGGVTLSFVLVLLLLNLLLSRMVLVPVRRVHDAMARAATGDLQARLLVPSRDEVGSMAESFNRMVGELETSRRAIEGYSRNLEEMVEARTGELRASQASLLALKNHLATVIANVDTGVLSLDETGRIETFNERAGAILGLAPEEARGRTLEEALGGAPTVSLVDAVAVVRDGREERRDSQVVCELAQGRRTLSVVASTLRGEGQRTIGTVVVVEDLTQILATQRLTAWKEAVERVIHEIKNPLTPVGLAAETLKTAWGRDPARFADLFPSAIDMILGAVRDLTGLIGEFSRFSRLPAMKPERLDPNALVLDALSPYRQAPIEQVKVRVDLAPDAPPVEVDADQLKRVLLNVINNALEAMGEKGGELRLRTAPEEAGVTIRVDDDGPGVEDVERIFEPHYTTKVKGTGLGLAIARQIVEEHGGWIRAESVPGQGTSVRIHLPAAVGIGAGR